MHTRLGFLGIDLRAIDRKTAACWTLEIREQGLQGFPFVARGQVIGLLGGSFDPPHGGHVLITKAALTRFGLDQLWWMVTPGNPLKKNAPAPLADRVRVSKAVMQHPRVKVTGIEERLGTRYTAETLRALMARYPQAQFVWLMGADNLAQFHTWQDWRWIMTHVPVGVLARPGERISARMSKTSRLFRDQGLPGRASQLLSRSAAPTWCFVNVPMSDASSSEIRAKGEWQA